MTNFKTAQYKAILRPVTAGLGVLMRAVMATIMSAVIGVTTVWGAQAPSQDLVDIYEWHDPTGVVSFQELPAADSEQWLSLPTTHPANTQGVTWLRFTLANNSDEPKRYIVSLDEAFVEDIQIFQTLPDGAIRHQRSGLVVPLQERPIKTRMPAFEVTVEPHVNSELWLSYRSKFEAVLSLQVQPPNEFATWADWQSSLYMLFFGCALAILIFNLLLFLALRDWLYLIYAGHIACVIGFVLRFSGFDLYVITTPEGHYRLGIISWLQAILLIEFARRLLNIGALSRKLDWLLKALMLVSALLALATWIDIDFYSVGIRLAIPMLVVLLGVGIYASVKGNVLGRFLVLAQTPYVLGYLLLAGVSTGALAPSTLNRYGFIFGSAIELLLFTLALGYRVKQLASEKEQAQEDLLDLQTSLKNQLQDRVDAQTRDLQQAASQLRSLTADYSALLNNIDTGVGSLATDGEVLFANQALNKLKQAIPNLAHDIAVRCLCQPMGFDTTEVSLEDARSTVRHLLMKLHVSHADQSEQVGRWVVVTDITELRSQQAQLNHSAKMATLGAMSTGMAHELNQPLNAIRLGLHNIKRSANKDALKKDALLKRVETIDEQVSRAAKLITHMRTFGRVSKDAFEPFELEAAITRATDLLHEQLRLEQIDLVLPVSTDEKHYTMGDPLQFEQVLINLISNAREAINEHNGLRLITLKLERTADTHVVTIEDTGGGIPPEHFDRIFEPFFTTKEVGQGTGLGGSISYGIVKDMQGDITVSNTRQGAEFKVHLPAVDP